MGMKIIAFETSCDETACAIVQDGRRVLANVVSTQADLHKRYGGVVPEVASREHLLSLNHVLEQALAEANLQLDELDAVATTLGPGLVGSLLVGANAAKTLAFLLQKPFLGVHHLYGHVASNFLESDLAPPFLCLLVSGGHTQLIHITAYDQMTIIGETLDDAAGEAYDKIARVLGLGYPGGPALDKLAQQGNSKRYQLPRGRTKDPFNFSFSGLKTAASRLIEKELSDATDEVDQVKADLAATFQKSVVRTLVEKTLAAAQEYHCQTIAVAGGVAANSGLRALLQEVQAKDPNLSVVMPALKYCTDNAAMIASSAYFNPITTDIRAEVFSRQPQFQTA